MCFYLPTQSSVSVLLQQAKIMFFSMWATFHTNISQYILLTQHGITLFTPGQCLVFLDYKEVGKCTSEGAHHRKTDTIITNWLKTTHRLIMHIVHWSCRAWFEGKSTTSVHISVGSSPDVQHLLSAISHQPSWHDCADSFTSKAEAVQSSIKMTPHFSNQLKYTPKVFSYLD